MSQEQIGVVEPRSFGHTARCGLNGCGSWYKDVTGPESLKDAERMLQWHAETAHPPSLPVYREVAS